MTQVKIKILAGEGNKRLDVILAKKLTNLTRSKIQQLIELAKVLLIKEESQIPIIDNSYKVKDFDEFIIDTTLPSKEHIIANELTLEVIFEDDYIAVINKPANLVVHPGAGNYSNTLVNGLLFKYKDSLSTINGSIRPGIVHRLDKDTSGILVIAKDDHSHSELSKQFSAHSIERSYRALVWGKLPNKTGTIETMITRSTTNRQKMMVSKNKGKKAITKYKVLKEHEELLSLVDLTLHTGRTHQIRVHMAHLGNAVVADPVYAKMNNKFINHLDAKVKDMILNLNRQALHAYKLGFIHPITKEFMRFKQQEPQDLLTLYKNIFTLTDLI